MASLNFFDPFYDDIAEGIHSFGSDTLFVALTNASNAPVATDGVLADLTEIAYTNLSSRQLSVASSTQTGGTYSLVLNDLTLSASGGAVAAFRYVVIYNDTPTTPKADPLVGWYDYGSELTLSDGDSLEIQFGANFFTIS